MTAIGLVFTEGNITGAIFFGVVSFEVFFIEVVSFEAFFTEAIFRCNDGTLVRIVEDEQETFVPMFSVPSFLFCCKFEKLDSVVVDKLELIPQICSFSFKKLFEFLNRKEASIFKLINSS
jgi:hypothetical protein